MKKTVVKIGQGIEMRTVKFTKECDNASEDHLLRTFVIDLKKKIKGDDSLKFLRAEVDEIERMGVGDPTGCARIHVSIEGKESSRVLIMDASKGCFLDHLDGKEEEKTLQAVAPKICDLIGSILYPSVRKERIIMEWKRLSKREKKSLIWNLLGDLYS